MVEHSIRRHYASIVHQDQGTQEYLDWQIHYRQAGEGAPVILLHPSPFSSQFMAPLIQLFATHSRAIAWDTPGYGQSDALPTAAPGLDPYVEALHNFIDALDLTKPVIYGSATGAQIAIEYARKYPKHVRGLLLENVAWFFDEEREAMMAPYFPSIAPQSDGSHFQLVWKMASQLYRYFPWYDTSNSRLTSLTGAPVDLVHQSALHYLLAGNHYDRAYRAAFMNEKPEPLISLEVVTRIIRWQGSMLRVYTDRLDDAELPENIAMRHAPANLEARFSTLEQTLQELL